MSALRVCYLLRPSRDAVSIRSARVPANSAADRCSRSDEALGTVMLSENAFAVATPKKQKKPHQHSLQLEVPDLESPSKKKKNKDARL